MKIKKSKTFKNGNLFYKKNIGTRKKEFIKVYSKMPTEIPEIFRKGNLIAYDKAEITSYPLLPKHCEVRYVEHTMTGQEEIDQMLRWQCTEITEEEYKRAIEKIKELITQTENIFNSL